jgi:membrane protein implicated in regulation of membrane protease activity
MDFAIVFWHWWAFATLLLVVELLVSGMFFLWMAVAAFTTGLSLLLAPSLGLDYQILIFSLLSLASIALSRKYLHRHSIVSDHPLLNRRAAQYVGRVFVLEDPVVNGEGRLRIDDSIWRIRGEDCPAGARIRVVSAHGVILDISRIG